MTFYDYLKNIFIILIIIQLTPGVVTTFKKVYDRYIEQKTKVGFIDLRGTITKSEHYLKYLNQYFKDTSIKAILLKIDSPGGASGSSQAIFYELLELKKKYPKPVISLIENICTSGAYYIAAATDTIIAEGPSAIIGGIGTTMPYTFKLKPFIEHYKIKYEQLDAGKYKSSTNPFVELTPETRKHLQALLDNSYQQFVQDIALQRNIAINKQEEWANGKILTAQQAKALGLIDKIASWSLCIDFIKEKALIEGEIEWIKPAVPSQWARLFGATEPDDDDSLPFSLTSSFLTTLLKELTATTIT